MAALIPEFEDRFSRAQQADPTSSVLAFEGLDIESPANAETSSAHCSQLQFTANVRVLLKQVRYTPEKELSALSEQPYYQVEIEGIQVKRHSNYTLTAE